MTGLHPGSRAMASVVLLATLLGAAAPLAHAHLDAAGLAAAGLCGEHHGGAATAETAPCSLCVAGAHVHTALNTATTGLPLNAALAATLRVPAPTLQSEHEFSPLRSRAPPQA